MTFNWAATLPSHWKLRKLKHIADLRLSNADKKSVEGEQPIRLCNYVDVYKNDFIVSTMPFMEATANDNQIRELALRAGDVLITKDSEEWSDIAVPALVPADLPGVICGYHLAHIRPQADTVFGGYLFRAFAADGIADQFRVAANGITRYGISKDDISSSLFPVPPLAEQRAIAAFLDRKTAEIDAVIAKKERLIALLQEERQALISHAVTRGLDASVAMKDSGIPWLGEVPKHWEVKKLKYLAAVLRGKFTHRPRNDPRLYDGPYPFIQTGDVASADKYIRTYSQTLNDAGFAVSKQFPAGTLVMSIAANIGDIAILTFDACFPDSIVGFLPLPDVHDGYLYHLLGSMRDEMLSTATLNTQLNLNIDRIIHLEAPLPPHSEQAEIAGYIEKQVGETHKIAACILQQITKLREYRQVLISAAVTGKLAVPQEVAT